MWTANEWILSIIMFGGGIIVGFIIAYMVDPNPKCPKCFHKNTKKELYCHRCQTKLP